MSVYQKTFFYGFIFASLVSFSPLKIFSYFSPIIIILSMFLFTEDKIRIAKLFLVVLITFILLLLFNLIIQENFIIQNYILAFLTYSTIYSIIFLDSKKLSNLFLLERILSFILPLFTVEGIIGLMQAINGFFHTGGFGKANGDFVEGTIHIGILPELAFSNVMFAVNMIFMGLCLLILFYVFNKKVRLRLFIGLFAIVLASVVHAILLFTAAILFSFILIKPKFELQDTGNNIKPVGKKFVLTLLIFGIFSAVYFIGNNISQLGNIVSNIFLGNYPRAIVTLNVIYDIPKKESLVPIVGLGLGQFSSRASLIGSGLYLGGINHPRSAPFLKNEINPIANNFVVYLMVHTANIEWMGSSQQPYYSLLSVYSETGITGILCLFFFIFKILSKVKKNSKENEKKRFLSFIFFTGVIFIVSLGIQENYYEIPQAILIGVLLLKVIYSVIVYEPAGNEV